MLSLAADKSVYCSPRHSRCIVRRTSWFLLSIGTCGLLQMPNAAATDPPTIASQTIASPEVESQDAGPQELDGTEQPQPAEADASQVAIESEYRNEVLRGRVVWLAEALKTRFRITTVPEVAEYVLALQTEDGSLMPVVENLRGRAFRKDPRLREMDLEVLVRRFEKQPFVQIVKIIEVDGPQRYEIDYWCDVCAIIMYEYGPCSCCQDQNRLRKQLVTPTK